ncbi:hypothetical protein M8J75_009790 [Diaphorina citri]|nr:hypothetical protein M8J75_009790 [Diaphorina citri]
MNWNVEGLSSVLSNSPETNVFKDADVICLSETLCTEEPPSIPGYYSLHHPAKQGARGRPVGGLAIYSKPFTNINLKSLNSLIFPATTTRGPCGCTVYFSTRCCGFDNWRASSSANWFTALGFTLHYRLYAVEGIIQQKGLPIGRVNEQETLEEDEEEEEEKKEDEKDKEEEDEEEDKGEGGEGEEEEEY